MGTSARSGRPSWYNLQGNGVEVWIHRFGGNKTCTLKVWYESEILHRRSFLKVQINFVESMCFPPELANVASSFTFDIDACMVEASVSKPCEMCS
jgi:hypothetical protein